MARLEQYPTVEEIEEQCQTEPTEETFETILDAATVASWEDDQLADEYLTLIDRYANRLPDEIRDRFQALRKLAGMQRGIKADKKINLPNHPRGPDAG